MLKEHLKALFDHSKKELNGLLVFCILLVLIILLPTFHHWLQPEEVYNFDDFKKEIAAFGAQTKQAGIADVVKKEVRQEPEYFAFDPNNLSIDEWKRLGLSERQIRVIKNYESKRGRFYNKEDLKKIYSISPSEYQKLEPFIKIPQLKRLSNDSSHRFDRKSSIRAPREVIVVEVNSADSALLETLKGIGPAFASRIIKYRNRLGGFYSKLQLKEVYGLDSLKYEELKDQVLVDASLIRKININTAGFDDWKGHPYLRYSQINAIIQYRKQHGNYNSINDVKKISIINEENFRKIEPYLNL